MSDHRIVDEDVVDTAASSGQRLYEYWVNQHVCPRFRTFDEAHAANPLRRHSTGHSRHKTATFAP
jgi:hypothetical protein